MLTWEIPWIGLVNVDFCNDRDGTRHRCGTVTEIVEDELFVGWMESESGREGWGLICHNLGGPCNFTIQKGVLRDERGEREDWKEGRELKFLGLEGMGRFILLWDIGLQWGRSWTQLEIYELMRAKMENRACVYLYFPTYSMGGGRDGMGGERGMTLLK